MSDEAAEVAAPLGTITEDEARVALLAMGRDATATEVREYLEAHAGTPAPADTVEDGSGTDAPPAPSEPPTETGGQDDGTSSAEVPEPPSVPSPEELAAAIDVVNRAGLSVVQA